MQAPINWNMGQVFTGGVAGADFTQGVEAIRAQAQSLLERSESLPALEEDFGMWDEEEGEDFGEFQLRLPDPEPALPLPYSVVGRKPLADNYGASVVFADRDSVVAELPVLVARNPTDFASDFWLIGELWVGGSKVAETRQMVNAASLAQSGPTVAFLKMMAPIPAKSGELEFKVFKSVDGETKEDLFRNVLPFQI